MLLVVDDQPSIRQLLYEALSGEGYRVEVAANGREAVAKVQRERPELILLDLKMPGLSGLETLQEIQKYTPGVPVILVTAYGELSDPGGAERMGVRSLILKPFDLNDVRNTVRGILDGNV
ncbi:MAG: response regulator [Thermoanaerobacterales bacterium]|nr:response regulator [Thermoanaerobacterales bacterium]